MHAFNSCGLAANLFQRDWKVRMSIYSKVLLAIHRDGWSLFIAVLFLALLSTTAMGQQPLQHIPPVGTQPIARANQISAPANFRSRGRDFVPRAVRRSAEVLHSDTKVVRASYENQSETPPIRAARAPFSHDLPWSYELRNLNYEQFESMLTEIWGARIRGKALDDEKRMIRIFLPDSKSSPEQTMKFDRVNRIATFEGAPNRKASWFQLMRDMDSSQELGPSKAMRIIDIGDADQRLIRQVAFAVNQDQGGDQGGFAPFRQDDQPQTTELIDLNRSALSEDERRRRIQELDPPVFPDNRKVEIIIFRKLRNPNSGWSSG